MKGKKRAKIRFPLSLRIQNPAALPSKSSQRFLKILSRFCLKPWNVLHETLEGFRGFLISRFWFQNKNFVFHLPLHSPFTTLLREDRMRLGKSKSENFVFHLSLHSPFTIFAA